MSPVARESLILTLGKVLIAAAWADGEIAQAEKNSLKDLLFRLPEVSGREWKTLEIYLDHPVEEEERRRLVQVLMGEIASPAEKALALKVIDEIAEADGVVTDEEQAVVGEIRAAIESVSASPLNALPRLVRVLIGRRSDAVEQSGNREDQLEDFIHNKIFYTVSRRLGEEGLELKLPDLEQRRLCLAGGQMARVAHVDKVVTEEERATMVEALRGEWGLSREAAEFVTEVAVSEVIGGLDPFRLNREFYEATTRDERIRFLDVLFSVAAADGEISHAETEEIRAICVDLKLEHRVFIGAKVRAKGRLHSA